MDAWTVCNNYNFEFLAFVSIENNSLFKNNNVLNAIYNVTQRLPFICRWNNLIITLYYKLKIKLS